MSPPDVPPPGWAELVRTYRPAVEGMLLGGILPFWERALDRVHGGVFSCWDNEGRHLRSRNKFTWSQGRVTYLWCRVAERLERLGRAGEAAAWRAEAARTADFLEANVFLPEERCAFLLSETGQPQEAFPGAGLAPSLYADAFVALGLAEQAAAAGDADRLRRALALGDRLAHLIAVGAPTHPDPVPAGFAAYAPAMILLNVRLVAEEACAQILPALVPAATQATAAAAGAVREQFLDATGVLRELRPHRPDDADTMLARHLNPGHALEGLWMLLQVAARASRADWTQQAAAAVRTAWAGGWDAKSGGLLHYVDAAGGTLRGRRLGLPLEERLLSSWDTKLWWVHSEALHACLLAYRQTGDPALAEAFRRTWDYVARTFPHPDPAVGEWIQIRDRSGRPLEQVVALPVKDPYHIARNLLQLLALFDEIAP